VVRRRKQKTAIALIVAIVLILLGYLTREAVETPRAGRKHVGPGVYEVKLVYDGDSLKLANGAGVRLAGIDAPDRKWDMHYADEARDYVKEMLEGRSVRLELAEEHTDRYGRNLAYLYLEGEGGEAFLNADIVRRGCAYAYPYKPNVMHADEILAAQKEAQAAKRGLWARPVKNLKTYVVTTSRKYSLTHRPSCGKLKKSKLPRKNYTRRRDALNHNGGAPPCRECKP